MFSGKTEELLRRLNRARIARQSIAIFKPAFDTRYHQTDVVSHNANSIRSTPVHNSYELLLLAGHCQVVGIDEAQFFDEGLPEVCVKVANQQKRFISTLFYCDRLGQVTGLVYIGPTHNGNVIGQ
jgi:thymidine kinase